MGIVTLEDILREIVGDIGDEFEVDEKQVEKQADGTFLVDASMEVEQFTQAFGFELPEGDFDTLGGFLSSLAGHLPDVGERFTYGGWQFTVAAKEGARIDRVRLVRLKGGTAPGKDKDKDKDKDSRAEPRAEASPPPKA
jgi:CBS domain containing-hemolysin-like protein